MRNKSEINLTVGAAQSDTLAAELRQTETPASWKTGPAFQEQHGRTQRGHRTLKDEQRCRKLSGGKYLLGLESGRDPGVLLQGAARVVVRGGVPLEFVHELGDRLLHLHGHGGHCMLLAATLTVRADLPAEDRGTERSVRGGGAEGGQRFGLKTTRIR